MIGFFKSFAPLLKKLKKYLLEIILLIVALAITITSFAIYAKNNQGSEKETETPLISPMSQKTPVKIFVDVSGAVKKPNIYQIDFGARLKDIIDKAGGLSDEADLVFFNRNFNLARIVIDQEKIYVPSTLEINTGVFMENPRMLDYASPRQNSDIQIETTDSFQESTTIINLNSATVEELDQLPGIGQITANKIISSRPYLIIDELLTKKVVNKSVFEKIKGLISTN